MTYAAAAAATWSIPQLVRPEARLLLILGDLAQLLIIIVVYYNWRTFRDALSQQWVLAVLTVAQIIAGLVGLLLASDGGRFNPPQFLLISLSIALVRRAGTSISRLLAASCLTACTLLTFLSGNRLVLLAIPLMMLASLTATISTAKVIGALGLALAVLLLAPNTITTALEMVSDDTRFEALGRGELDDSSAGRLDEYRDIRARVSEHWRFHDYILGEGSGAQYEPHLSITRSKARPDGLFHAVHIGPVRILFRYGLLGLAIGLWFSRRVVENLKKNIVDGTLIEAMTALAAVGILLDMLVRNPFLDPMNALLFGLAARGPLSEVTNVA